MKASIGDFPATPMDLEVSYFWTVTTRSCATASVPRLLRLLKFPQRRLGLATGENPPGVAGHAGQFQQSLFE